MTGRFSYPTKYHYQEGAVLVISLILLLVMTLIGVSAAKSSVLEAMMTANTQFQIQSLAAAEATIKTGENDIDTIVTDSTALVFETTGDHYYLTDPGGGTSAYSSKATTEGSYAIEYVGPRRIAGESDELGAATAGSFVYVFFVNAQNESGKGASRNVQSLYFSQSAP